MKTVETTIERSIFEVLRLALVANGYTPNITTFADTPAGYQAYLTALAAIVPVKGFAVELFGASAVGELGLDSVPRIVIALDSFLPGDIGLEEGVQYEMNTISGNWDAFIQDGKSYNIGCSLLLETKNINEARILSGIIFKVFGSRGYLQDYAGTQKIFYEFTSGGSDDVPRDGTMLRVFQYRFYDLTINYTPTGEHVSPLEQADIGLTFYQRFGLTPEVPYIQVQVIENS